MSDRKYDLILASLLGGAMGDSLGAEIEFWPLRDIRGHFPEGLTELPPHDGRRGAITDDTQMTLFTAEGLINAILRQDARGICDPVSVVHHALLRWLKTQEISPRMQVDSGGLLADQRLHRRRAPGNTCLSSLAAAERFGDTARNDSKGCGAIMRVAPVAFLNGANHVQLAMGCSALTHGHVAGQEAAAAWASILSAAFRGNDVEEAARSLLGRFRIETDNALRAALDAPRDGKPETIEDLGGGWVAEEALAIALYSVLAANGFEHGLRIAVTHSGDSDSTGAIAGNLLGLCYPDEVLAHRWRTQLECLDLIEVIAHDLWVAAHAGSGGGVGCNPEAELRGRYAGY